ncbi:MAG TPA: hypothetical protein DEG28_05950 [Porphyromonadaceae bacterium]|nr:hypothetical protein [Porphyromonadaceae bacterium]
MQNNNTDPLIIETMEEKKASTLFEEMKDDVAKYITNTLELGKLEIIEKISKASSNISYVLVIAFVALFALLMLLTTLALYLGELLQNIWAGFGIVSGGILVILLILLFVKKPIRNSITNKVIRFLMESDDNEDIK